LPTEVDAYYKIKERCLEQGWQPGTPLAAAANPQQISGPHRVLAQALMKRAIADIPIVQHIQKEASGMNKLYAQSMCSVHQWKSFQNAEAMIAAEIDSVRGEADALDPGWSQYVWKQAMQYHQALKQKNEMEEKKKQELANQRKIVEANVAAAQAARTKEEQETMAQQAAEELLKAEERDKQSKKAFSAKSSTMKKGFLDNNNNNSSTTGTGTSSSNSNGKTGAKGKKKK
jgi:Preprotein translocase subunit Sec66